MKTLIKKSLLLKIVLFTLAIQIVVNIYFVSEPGLEEIRKQQQRYAPAYVRELQLNSKQILDKVVNEIVKNGSYNDVDIPSIVENSRLNYNLVTVDPMIKTLERNYIQPKLYVWVSDTNHELVSGFPASDFGKLNASFKKDIAIIESDNFLKNKDEYFSILLGYTGQEKQNSEWRFNDEFKRKDIQSEYGRFYFSKTLKDESGKKVGTVYLKIDDSDNRWIIYADREHEQWKDLRRYAVLTNLFAFLIYWLILPSWVYSDARKRKLSNPLVWAFFPLFSFVIGWLIYLAVRSKIARAEQPSACTSCETLLPDGADFCPHCGRNVTQENKCPECSHEVKSEWSFCPSCRTSLKS